MEVIKQQIAELLGKTIGFDVSSIGETTFHRALETRMNALAIDEPVLYFERLSSSYMELRRLIEEVVVPETWFFRDQQPFSFLSKHILQSKKYLSGKPFRILSIPSSTGEEPYSIVMTLMDAGLHQNQFHVDGIDVSERVLARARKGIYRGNSFRTKDLTFRDRYFVKEGNVFEIKENVREKVQFLQGNILQPGFIESLGQYDVVFCRNVLIYFNPEAQEQVIGYLYNLLLSGGLLFTGYSEASLFFETPFVPVSRAKTFAFYKEDAKSVETKLYTSYKSNALARQIPRPPSKPALRTKPSTSKKPSALPAKAKNKEYTAVKRLADEGALEEAANRSETYLSLHDPSANWYCLLGVIRDCQGRKEDAMDFFRKALYLDPTHVESLIQLSLLVERNGDLERAKNYKRRAQRLLEENVNGG